jgi:hypothetical protein
LFRTSAVDGRPAKEMTERLKMPLSSSWQVVSQDLSFAIP